MSKLSNYAVIPKYGFPIDVVNLNISKASNYSNNYNLQRDLSIAISEYAPESEVLVNGEKFTSRYINLSSVSALKRQYYSYCSNCGSTTISDVPFSVGETCSNCGKKISNLNDFFIIPRLGFSTDLKQTSAVGKKPKKTYAGTIKYIGDGTVVSSNFNYKGKIFIDVVKNDKLAVLNENPFYYCEVCGYTEIKRGIHTLTTTGKPHQTSNDFKCPNKELKRVALGHVFTTDVVKIKFNITERKFEEYITLLYTLIEATIRVLQIERSDINGLVVANSSGSFDIILFDNCPGGAGYVKAIANNANLDKILIEASKIANQTCCNEDTTCYSCLNNFYNQAYQGIMKRKYAINILKELL